MTELNIQCAFCSQNFDTEGDYDEHRCKKSTDPEIKLEPQLDDPQLEDIKPLLSKTGEIISQIQSSKKTEEIISQIQSSKKSILKRKTSGAQRAGPASKKKKLMLKSSENELISNDQDEEMTEIFIKPEPLDTFPFPAVKEEWGGEEEPLGQGDMGEDPLAGANNGEGGVYLLLLAMHGKIFSESC